MFFIPIKGLVDGYERANDENWEDLANLMQADKQAMVNENTAQVNREFMLGAPGRERAIGLESDTVLQSADMLEPRIGEVAAGRANRILGDSALRSLKGIYDQASVRSIAPNIPQLAQNAAQIGLNKSGNQVFSTGTLTPQRQEIQAERQQFTLNNMALETQTKLRQMLGSSEKAQQVLDLIGMDTQLKQTKMQSQMQVLPSQTQAQIAGNEMATVRANEQAAFLPEQYASKREVLPSQTQAQIAGNEANYLKSEEQARLIPDQYRAKREDLQNKVRRKQIGNTLKDINQLFTRSPSTFTSTEEALTFVAPFRKKLVDSKLIPEQSVISVEGGQWMLSELTGKGVVRTPLKNIVTQYDRDMHPQRYKDADNRAKKDKKDEAPAPPAPAAPAAPAAQPPSFIGTPTQGRPSSDDAARLLGQAPKADSGKLKLNASAEAKKQDRIQSVTSGLLSKFEIYREVPDVFKWTKTENVKIIRENREIFREPRIAARKNYFALKGVIPSEEDLDELTLDYLFNDYMQGSGK